MALQRQALDELTEGRHKTQHNIQTRKAEYELKKAVIIAVIIAVIAACAAGAAVYHNNKIKEMREAGIKTLNESVSLEDYRAPQQKKISKILADAEEKINEADSEADIADIIKHASESIGKVKTDAELTKEEEEAAAQAAAEAARARAAAAARQSSGGKKSSGSRGCVGNDSKNFY